MPITIQGIKLKSVSITYGDDGAMQLQGNYELVSTSGIALARQSFNGYNDLKLNLSPVAAGHLTVAIDGIRSELNKTLGME